ncbi:hypothetical protein KQH82_06435 [bacterium]|nr:hypothetical protein [bacterium]
MKRLAVITAVLVLAPILAASAADNDYPMPTMEQQRENQHALPSIRTVTGQLITGYNGGTGVHASFTFNNFAEGFPFSLRAGVGHSWVAPGDAVAARRIFIDQNTNGEPRSKAKVWDVRLDVMYPVQLFNLKHTSAFGGPRHTAYEAYFEYIGGNETFDVISKSWGVGGGLETSFPVSPRVSMIVVAGADYFFRSELSGHDTYYRPDGDDLNAKESFTYDDADKAVEQPDFETRIMFGVSYQF